MAKNIYYSKSEAEIGVPLYIKYLKKLNKKLDRLHRGGRAGVHPGRSTAT